MNLYQEKIDFVKRLAQLNIKTREKLEKKKRGFCAEFKLKPIRNAELRTIYMDLVKKGEVEKNETLMHLLQKRSIRTISGVAPISVLAKPYPCPGKCIFCPTEYRVPKSYLSDEPGVMRAIRAKYDPYEQVQIRLKTYAFNGHSTDKIELIVQGGTWSYYERDYKIKFTKELYDSCNNGAGGKDIRAKTLKEAQDINETTKNRVVGLTYETRPDFVNEREIKFLRELGCTRIEIGVQNIYNDVLDLNERGHKIEEVIRATKMLKEAGFKITFHMMPNLPGSDLKRDLQMFKELFSNPDFQPDMLKIYPCAVLKNSQLYTWWQEGKFKSYEDQDLFDLLIDILRVIPRYVRINRLIRDIPTTLIQSGNMYSNLRQMLDAHLEKNGEYCKDIRAREARNATVTPEEAVMYIEEYEASGGKEYFIWFGSKDKMTLYAFTRLRINETDDHYIPALQNAALIRELHTYGKLVPINEQSEGKAQHVGFGKRLMAKAESIAKEHNKKSMAVISGIGVREYYRKIGYTEQDTYMVKNLEN